jgi:hypothetical protein
LLSVYAPISFNEAMEAQVPIQAEISTVYDDAPKPNNVYTSPPGAPNKGWIISNTTLLLPAALAAGVCYFAFMAMTHEVDALHERYTVVNAANDDMLKHAIEQNARLAEALEKQTEAAFASEKALQDQLIKAMTEKPPARLTP